MISHAIRMWLLSLTAMSVVSWVTTVYAFVVLYFDEALGVATSALIALWAVAVPIPVTFHAIRWWRRAHRALHLARKHRRSFEELRGEITSSLR